MTCPHCADQSWCTAQECGLDYGNKHRDTHENFCFVSLWQGIRFWWLCTCLHAVGFHLLLTQKAPISTQGNSTVFIPSSILGCCFVVSIPPGYSAQLESHCTLGAVSPPLFCRWTRQVAGPQPGAHYTWRIAPLVPSDVKFLGIIFAMTPFSHRTNPTLMATAVKCWENWDAPAERKQKLEGWSDNKHFDSSSLSFQAFTLFLSLTYFSETIYAASENLTWSFPWK